MNFGKESLIEYFENNKWDSESFEKSFLNDFNNAILTKNLKFENIKDDFINIKDLDEINYHYLKLNIKNENNLIFIPLYTCENKFIGIGYLFSDKSLDILNKFKLKTFCKFVINQKDLNKMLKV